MQARESREWIKTRQGPDVLVLSNDRSEVVLLIRAALEGLGTREAIVRRAMELSSREGPTDLETYHWVLEFERLVRVDRIRRGPGGYWPVPLVTESD